MAVVDTITVEDFKNYFVRDFPYLPVWLVTKTYNSGTVVYYEVTELFYTCKNNGTTSTPDTTADWDLTDDSVENYVLDSDIQKAMDEAKLSFNESLFESSEVAMVFYYITAHYLVLDIRRASEGLESTDQSLVSSRSVGSVSESYSIPSAWTDNPILNYFTKTSYGTKYLSMVMPRLIGNVNVVAGATLA